MRKSFFVCIPIVTLLCGCTTITIPAGYQDCGKFTNVSTGSYPSPSKLDGLDARSLANPPGSLEITQNGSVRGLQFGPSQFPVALMKSENEKAVAYGKAWVRFTTIGKSEKRSILFWDANNAWPIKTVEIPANIPEGVSREVEYVAPVGHNVVVVGLVGSPSISGAVCFGNRLSSSSSPNPKSVETLGRRLKYHRH